MSRVSNLGDPFVFVSGNHDSDSLQIDLARRGAVVLTEEGQLMPDGSYGDVIVDVKGLKVAGYRDPFERRASEDFKDRFQPSPTPEQQDAFTAWLMPLIGKVDVVMVHEPALIEPALAILEDDPPARPLVFITGHTHEPDLDRQRGRDGDQRRLGRRRRHRQPDRVDQLRPRAADLHDRADLPAAGRRPDRRSTPATGRRARSASGSRASPRTSSSAAPRRAAHASGGRRAGRPR